MYEPVRYLPMRPAPETPTYDAGVVDSTLTRDADRTQREILDVATQEFAEQGSPARGSTRSPPAPAPRSG